MPATTRKPDDAYPKFIIGRMPMIPWARDYVLEHYTIEAHKVATARLRAEEEKYRKRTGRQTIPGIIKLRPVKSPEKPKDLPENPPPWRKRTKPMGHHFWPERVPCKWLLPGITLSDWNTPQGMLQMKYESEDMTEKVFRSLLMEAIHRESNNP